MSPSLQNYPLTVPKLDADVPTSWYRWHQAAELRLGRSHCLEIVTGEITRDTAYLLEGMDSSTLTDHQNIIFDEKFTDPVSSVKYKSEFDRRDSIAVDFIISTVSHSLLPIIYKTWTSASAYEALKFQFLGDNKKTVNDTLQHLNGAKFNFGDDLKIFLADQEHTWNLFSISSNKNTSLSDDIYISMIIKSMPIQFDQYITNLKTSESIKDSNDLKKKLLIIYNDINKGNYKEMDDQTFTVQKPKVTL